MANPYRVALQRHETPREAEARLLHEISRDLEAAHARKDHRRLVQEVGRVRSLWTTFALDLADDRNALPAGLKASLLSIAGAVDRSCSAALAGDAEAVAALVAINRNVAGALG
jgi:flagellar biosynthesis regulator FlaF